MRSVDAVPRGSIAIVGIGCRLPGGADSPTAFWRLLSEEIDAVVEVPPDRWSVRRHYHPDRRVPGKSYVRHGGFLQQPLTLFDPEFFHMSPREASRLDPQHRWLLEVCWEAIEDAGMDANALAGTDTGVFVGLFTMDRLGMSLGALNRRHADSYDATGAMHTLAANRLSHFLDLRGPSLAVDTACSSSLVATHLACQSIWRGECGLALVGGANAMFNPDTNVPLAKASFLSPDGRCKAFDARADGYGRGEGAAMVVLKPLAAAERDGDRIYAVICASGVNQDGRTDTITAPNHAAQKALLCRVYGEAGVRPIDVAYVEAHGTGTRVGDDAEISALADFVRSAAPRDHLLPVGSVKTNIGHLEAAAGVAGLIKAALCLHHGALPANLHFQQSHPLLNLSRLGLRVVQRLEALPPSSQNNGPLYVGVNSFGFGGTNAHIVLQQHHHGGAAPRGRSSAPEPPAALTGRPWVLALSARSMAALKGLVAKYAAFVASARTETASAEELFLRDLCFSAGVGRSHHEHRLAVVASSRAQLQGKLQALTQGRPIADAFWSEQVGQTPQLVFVYTGMGAQSFGMGRELFEQEPVYRDALHACATAWRRVGGGSNLLEAMLEGQLGMPMAQAAVAQPGNLALQIALTQLLAARGITAAAVMGHSVGEISAAHCAGLLDLEEAFGIIYHRSRLQQNIHGTMLALGLSQEQAGLLLVQEPGVSLAAVNSPSSVVLAGDHASLNRIADWAAAQHIFHRYLAVDVPYHSAALDPLEAEFKASLADVRGKPSGLPFFTSVMPGTPVLGGDRLDAEYWWRNARDTVQFAAAFSNILKSGYDVLVQIGPHPVLSGAMREVAELQSARLSALATLRRDRGAQQTLAELSAQLYAAGMKLDWKKQQPVGRKIGLPTYSWNHQHHWYDTPENNEDRLGELAPHKRQPLMDLLLGGDLGLPQRTWQAEYDDARLAYLHDHGVAQTTILPAAAFVEIGLAAAGQIFSTPEEHSKSSFENLHIHGPMAVHLVGAPLVRSQYNEKTFELEIFSRSLSTLATHKATRPWQHHATLRVLPGTSHGDTAFAPVNSWERVISAAHLRRLDVQEFYADLQRRGLSYGAAFRCVKQLYACSEEVWAEIALEEPAQGAFAATTYRECFDPSEYFAVHPCCLDACIHAAFAALQCAQPQPEDDGLFVPVSVRRAVCQRRLEGKMMCHARVRRLPAARDLEDYELFVHRGFEADLVVYDADGRVALELWGVHLQPSASISSAAAWSGLGAAAHHAPAEDEFLMSTWQPLLGHAATPNAPAAQTVLAAVPGNTGDAGAWVLVGEAECSWTALLAQELQRSGARSPEAFVVLNPHELNALEHWHANRPLRGVIFVAPAMSGNPQVESAHAACSATVDVCMQLAGVVRALVYTRPKQRLALMVVTRGVQTPQPFPSHHAGLWGVARVAAQEYPQLGTILADLTADCVADEAARHLAQLVQSPLFPEGLVGEELVLHAGEVYVHRLGSQKLPAATPRSIRCTDAQAYSLSLNAAGAGTKLCFKTRRRLPPPPHHVALQIHATAVNAKDVLKIRSVLPRWIYGQSLSGQSIGTECVGTVEAVGPKVSHVKPGDTVLAYAAHCFGSYVITAASWVYPIPPQFSSTPETALCLQPFVTAYVSLLQMARLKGGERVLIHTAAGSVGLAAVQCARLAGAQIFATCGTPEKQAYLKNMGVQWVSSSRSLRFFDDVMEWTNGAGVDVVLNTLPGVAMLKSLELLAPHGRLMDLGKRDIAERHALALEPFHRGLIFAAVDIDQMMLHQSGAHRRAVRWVLKHLQSGAITPLPQREFLAPQLAEAFACVGQGAQIGRTHVRFRGVEVEALEEVRQTGALFRPDAAYCITGGSGGLGLALAAWMAENGARHLCLLGRSRTRAPEAESKLAALRARGVVVDAAAVDVSDRAELASYLAKLQRMGPPLRGIMHAAMVLDDGLLAHLARSQLERVMAPKCCGARFLHHLTAHIELDFFVLWSSIAALVGGVGQAAYAAANAACDALAHSRRAQGLPALSINLGPITEVGVVARNPQLAAEFLRLGLRPMAPTRIFGALERFLRFPEQSPPQVALVDIDWPRWARARDGGGAVAPNGPLAQLVARAAPGIGAQASGSRSPGLTERVKHIMAAEPAVRADRVARELAAVIAEVLQAGALTNFATQDNLDIALTQFGLDSLLSFEMAQAIAQHFGVQISRAEMMTGHSVNSLAAVVLNELASAWDANSAN